MNKIIYGLMVGGVLGIFDGATAWFTPAVRPEITGIIFGSTIKGAIAGAAAGYFAKKVNSVPAGIAFGLGIGLLLARAVARFSPGPNGEHYYWEIMVPGSLVGAIAGFASQKYNPAAAK